MELGVEQKDMSALAKDAKLYQEQGIVRELWELAGKNIVYKRSTLEREGWSVPGPVNMDDEEDVGVEQDDLVVNNKGVYGAPLSQRDFSSDVVLRKRYFY